MVYRWVVIFYLAALGLAAMFGWAALAKLRSPDLVEKRFVAMGLPKAVGRILPWAEIGLAVVLVVFPSIGAGAALVFLVVSSVGICYLLARGKVAGCGCFGNHRELSWREVAHNGGLMLVGVAALYSEVPWHLG